MTYRYFVIVTQSTTTLESPNISVSKKHSLVDTTLLYSCCQNQPTFKGRLYWSCLIGEYPALPSNVFKAISFLRVRRCRALISSKQETQ